MSTRRSGGSPEKPDDPDLIVSRGLQELLDKERRKARPADVPGKKSTKKKGGSTPRSSTGPNFIFCYLCGRQFGHSSIAFHRPQCYLKKMIEWERGDPASRGPKPVDPETHDKRMKERGMDPTAAPGAAGGGGGMGGGGGRKAQYTDAYNQAQMEAFNQNALSPCPNCGRTFLPDRLQVHLRSCKPGSAAKPPPRAAAKSSTAPVSNPVTTNTNTEASTAAPTKSPSAARPSTGPTEKPIRASGSYAIPESVGEDSVPPGAAPKGAAAQAVSKRPSQSRKTPVTVNEKRVDSDEDSEGEIQFEEEPLMPPSVMQGRRSSMSAVQHEVEHETSSPSRPAAMEQSQSREINEVDTNEASQRSAASQTNNNANNANSHLGQSTGSAQSNSIKSNSQAPAESETAAPPVSNAPKAASKKTVHYEEEEPAEEAGEDGEQFGEGSGKKIALNNVSRFKNVQSRFKMEQKAQETSLTPCKYCNRKFNPDRVAKHEEVCIERNKPQPAAKHSPLKKAPKKSSPRPSVTKVASAPSVSTTTPKFCSSCGGKLIAADCKFCPSCGSKVMA